MGTFITIDHVLEQRETEGVVDIPGVIQRLRQTTENYDGPDSGIRMFVNRP